MYNKSLKICLLPIILLGAINTQATAQETEKNMATGLITIISKHNVSETINRLENALKSKGMTIFERVNHTAGAAKINLQLRPTELLIFGNPKVGTPLMLCSQTMAIDLPQKALAYEDKSGQVWLSYNDPAYLAKRHNIQGCEKPIEKVSKALANFAKTATE